MAVKLSRLNRFLDQRYPYALAESWDNVGLIIGDPGAQVERAMLALDLTLEVAQEAVERGCGVVISHHPPIFKAIQRIDASTVQGAIIAHCLRHGVASIALHTNLDSAQGGLNDIVGELIGLSGLRPLVDSGKQRLMKLAVFVPHDAAERVRNAMFEAGAGAIGKYDHCSFNLDGTGTFRGNADSNPTVGSPGTLERVSETRIEVLIRREGFGAVYSALLAAHPYEEVAYDLYPLENRERETGLGRIGRLSAPITVRDMCERLGGLGMQVLRHVGAADRRVQKVALCTGAGSDFCSHAHAAGADLYLSAEVKHHHALEAHRRGMAIIETDHFSLERIAMPTLKGVIESSFGETLEVIESERDRSAWTRYS